jgi:Fe-S cluster biosynthesis and repair protein YggX
MKRNIFCLKKKKDAEGLFNPPFEGKLGVFIYENISKESWNLWIDLQMKIINEYRLDLSNKNDKESLFSQMIAFLNLPSKEIKNFIIY